jgi:protease-4
MSRNVTLTFTLAAVALAAPSAAHGQALNLQRRALGEPAGIAVPNATTAGAEEATALEVNPAGVGFVDGAALTYFHEFRSNPRGAGDGFWFAAPLGAFVPALSMEWIRPGDRAGAHFRKTTFGLALAPSQALSIGVSGNWYASPDRDIDRLFGLDAGLTVRPSRHLSFAATALGLNSRLGRRRLPARYDFGVATRFWRDAVTLSGDLLTDDEARGDFSVRSGAVGLAVELSRGIALAGQIQFPVQSGLTGAAGATYGQLALTLQSGHAAVTTAPGVGDRSDGTWLVGARLTSERYRAGSPIGGRVPDIDMAKALSRPRSIFGGERDLYSALLGRIAEVREDRGAPALLVRIDDLPLGRGRADELRAELLAVRAVKPVIAYLVGGGMTEYWIASAATRVVVPPSSSVFAGGLASTTPFIHEGLSKLGVAFDVVAAGKYKSAPDPLVRGDMGEAQREATTALLDDVFEREVKGIAEARRLSEARVRELVDVGVFTSDAAREAGLVDGSAWPDELEGLASSLVGRRVSLATSWDRSPPRGAQRWGPRRAIALIRVEGVIAQGKSRLEPLGTGGIAGAETISRLVKQAADDRSVVAIVLRVDSPGGDGLASDLIWREVIQARRKGKPVVASMGDLAASGGYLVAVAADEILAEPSTITGSIGVFSVKPDLSGLLRKLGVNAVTLKRGAHADAMTVVRGWTAEERKLAEQQVLAFYDIFLSRVADGRHLARETVEQNAGGRVWTGRQARERGLVDRLGTIEDALAIAAGRAGLPPGTELEVRPFEPPRPFLDLGGAVGVEQESPLTRVAAAIPGLRAVALLGELGTVIALPHAWLYGASEDGGGHP